ncbi:hypothetical protein TIFTF001_006370 [Ficus carica]|uniref:Uncharacterized protein n=1 Tax=Ficus carica TaxID=3494 RepID=A0AA87ZIM3_FICCA|nr:hypothetical protein TIFTF001_006370 [Ficus carica]
MYRFYRNEENKTEFTERETLILKEGESKTLGKGDGASSPMIFVRPRERKREPYSVRLGLPFDVNCLAARGIRVRNYLIALRMELKLRKGRQLPRGRGVPVVGERLLKIKGSEDTLAQGREGGELGRHGSTGGRYWYRWGKLLTGGRDFVGREPMGPERRRGRGFSPSLNNRRSAAMVKGR